MKHLLQAAVAVFLTTSAAMAHDYKVGPITVMHPKAFETAKTAKVGGGYMTLENTSDTADTLLEVRVAKIPRVELHLTETDENGVARMTKQDGIPIPAGETVTLKPGGLHVMFMGLDGNPFKVGDKVDATLVFETAGELDITFDIEARSAKDHGTMNHSDHKDAD
ncbi:copper chaperone PCu(A)C [Sulfitobacter sp. F26169L]|uniref:copper chaperone PCu(A)C n=1 Tax=Sulfitobacter sp. F26169L TaxID=2996015 RepID=UPI0022609C2A|nr:copper chaperone PCu(A)C [Sulfitobacter sp. F26169L]MCX7566874.1 copper chaperone PCu(A)C [Sulfitobacter sp. F26169L]